MDGYYRLSCLMGVNPDLAILRRFRTAYAFNALALQAEIVALEQIWGSAIEADRDADKRAGRTPLDESIYELSNFQLNGNPSPQWEIYLKLRAKLKEFDEAKAQLLRACQSPPARPVNLKALRTWLGLSKGGHNFVHGLELPTFTDDADLTSLLDTTDEDDTISRWLGNTFLAWFHKQIWYRFKEHKLPLYEPLLSNEKITTPIDVYSDSTITLVTTSLSTILSSLLPCLSMFLLYYVQTPIIRLSTILILCTLFSTAMTLITKAKRETCFSSTAAFAAVLVVFVGSTDSSACACPTT